MIFLRLIGFFHLAQICLLNYCMALVSILTFFIFNLWGLIFLLALFFIIYFACLLTFSVDLLRLGLVCGLIVHLCQTFRVLNVCCDFLDGRR